MINLINPQEQEQIERKADKQEQFGGGCDIDKGRIVAARELIDLGSKSSGFRVAKRRQQVLACVAKGVQQVKNSKRAQRTHHGAHD